MRADRRREEGGAHEDVRPVALAGGGLDTEVGLRVDDRPRDLQGRRELALGCVATGAGLLALLPVGLAFFGSPWQSGRSRRAKLAK